MSNVPDNRSLIRQNGQVSPLVSIIMPAHNTEQFVAEAIQSVIAQTYSNWELIIIDDASTDKTSDIVKCFSDERIQYHLIARNGSPSSVRNTGLRKATGELIAFLDADDCYYPNTLAKLMKPLLDNPRYSAVYGFAREIDEDGNPLDQLLTLQPKASVARADEPAYELPKYYNHSWYSIATCQISCVLSGLMMRKSFLDAVGLLNESLKNTEDYEFYIRLFLQDYNGIHCLSDYVYQYRIHQGSLTKTAQHCESLLSNALTIKQWLFEESSLPGYAKAYRSSAFTDCYRYLARERLVNRQNALARQIIFKALQDGNIRRGDFLKYCMPLLLRSFLPDAFNQMLIQLKRQLKNERVISTVPARSIG